MTQKDGPGGGSLPLPTGRGGKGAEGGEGNNFYKRERWLEFKGGFKERAEGNHISITAPPSGMITLTISAGSFK